MVPTVVTSAGAFVWGIIRRFYVWAPTFLLDAADYQERYIEPRFGWSIDLPSEAFPTALGAGLFLAAMLTYHEARGKADKADVVFEVRESAFDLDSYNHSRPAQPFNLAHVTLKGQLRNRADFKADIEGVRVALMERGWFWIWRVLGDEQAATKLLGPLRAAIDLYHHGVSVDGNSRSRGISEIWAYPSIPVWLKPESRRAYRLRVLVDTYGQSHPTATYVPIDLPLAFCNGRAAFERIHRVLGKPSVSTQNAEEATGQ